MCIYFFLIQFVFLINNFFFLQCVEQSRLDWNSIMECSQGKLGVQLQNEALELTGAIAPKFVPTIVYNNVNVFFKLFLNLGFSQFFLIIL